jgi:hypothetical protein
MIFIRRDSYISKILKMKYQFFLLLFFGYPFIGMAQSTQSNTFCNPINIDYTYMIYNADKNRSYRSGADPAVVRFKNEYYLFVTRSLGYWH